jgi:hypothetical protein
MRSIEGISILFFLNTFQMATKQQIPFGDDNQKNNDNCKKQRQLQRQWQLQRPQGRSGAAP